MDWPGRARALAGVPFRPQGRDTRGLDCIGVAIETYALPPEQVRRDYRMRGDHEREVCDFLSDGFRRIAASQIRPGDLMVMRVADGQLHVGVRTQDGFVHAHAGLRRVVETPGMPEWPIIAVYRKRRR